MNGALGAGAGDVGDLDLELAVVAGRTALGSRVVRLDLVSDALGKSGNGGREGDGGGDGVTHIGGC